MVKLIVSGSRDITRKQYNDACELCEFEFDCVITGGARGPDTYAIEDAEDCGIDHKVIKADWEKHGRAIAGRWRNQTLADEGDMLFCVWDGVSKGSEDMIQRAIAKGLPYLVVLVKGDSKPKIFMYDNLCPKDLLSINKIERNMGDNDVKTRWNKNRRQVW